MSTDITNFETDLDEVNETAAAQVRDGKRGTTRGKAKPTGDAVMVVVPPLDLNQVRVRIEGTTPLIVNRFHEKARREILDKQMGKARQKKAIKDPKQQWEDSFYRLEDDPETGEPRYGFPVLAFKAAAVSAANDAGLKMTQMRRAFHVIPEEWHPDGTPVVRLLGEPDEMRDLGDVVRVGPSKSADIHFRGYFSHWAVELLIQYNARVITVDQLVNLLNNGGFGVGVGEHRPEKDGLSGMFRVAETA